MGRLFGTDGIRGKANIELTPELAYNVGRAGAYVITKKNAHKAKIIVGMDSRISGDMLESSLIAGMCSVGAEVICAGIIPTPAIAFLVRKYNLDAGVMISASHNPYEDNGIKFFDNDGYKLNDSIEDEIEKYINNPENIPRASNGDIGTKTISENALDDYISFLKSTVENNCLSGLKIAIDCANGASYKAAPLALFSLGAEVFVINNEPNGKNINENCGSTHMESVVEFVKENDFDIGFAFDGDGDRLIAVDENGEIIDGDQILSILANELHKENKLKNDTVVVTVMSNLGFVLMCKEKGINIEITDVGDRYVLENMLQNGHCLGGEQSGHIIFLEYNTTGDGILSAIQIASMLNKSGKKFSELNSYMKVLPQALVNAKVTNGQKFKFLDNSIIKAEIDALKEKFKDEGRILIRPSGTEPLIRVMIEGNNKDIIEKEAQRISDLMEKHLN